MVAITSLAQTLERIRRKEYSCLELVETLIARCEAAKSLNALLATDWDGLRRSAKQIDRHGNAGVGLCGIPLCFKANIATGIFPASAATPALINHLPKIPSRVAERLFQLEHCRVPRETCMSYRLELRVTTMPPGRFGTRGIQV